jgi:hypothetical protein
MTWFRVDDKFGEHAKVRRLAKDRVPAVGLWTLCGIWCADNEQDGFVPVEVVRRYDPRLRLAKRLVEVGLWHESTSQDEVGFEFHQWSEHQPTRAQIEERRKKTAVKVANWRAKKAAQRATAAEQYQGDEDECNPVTGQVTNQVSNPAPDPTRPVSTSPNGEVQPPSLRSGGGPRKRATAPKKIATRIPDDFAPTPEMVAWARENTPLVGRRETEDFVDYWRAKSGKDAEKADWPATWRRWMRRAQGDVEHNAPRQPNGHLAPAGREAKARGWLELGLADPGANEPAFGSAELHALEGGRTA